MTVTIGRRELLAALGGAVAIAARAQQTGRVWRVAVIGAVSPLPATTTSSV